MMKYVIARRQVILPNPIDPLKGPRSGIIFLSQKIGMYIEVFKGCRYGSHQPHPSAVHRNISLY